MQSEPKTAGLKAAGQKAIGHEADDVANRDVGREGRGWIAQLDHGERTTLIATFCGWMLDGMDVMVYSFVLPSLIVLWHISKGQAGLLGTSALLLSSLGGWLAGLAADRWSFLRDLGCATGF